tara:strand:+ start:101 stop:445 length:345 start_codon:yes stop_codon:yes gene_type:complete
MKISKTILKNIIREALESGDFDSIIGEEEKNASTDKLTNQFMDKVIRVAPTELSQIDDVEEVIETLTKLIKTLQEKNPTDFTQSEFKRVGILLKQLGMDMQNTNPQETEPGVPA